MIRIYGASDDLVEVEGDVYTDEFDCFEQDVELTITSVGNPKPPDVTTGVVVRMRYGRGGSEAAVWTAELSQLAEDTAMLPCKVFANGQGDARYSVVVEVDTAGHHVTMQRRHFKAGTDVEVALG